MAEAEENRFPFVVHEQDEENAAVRVVPILVVHELSIAYSLRLRMHSAFLDFHEPLFAMRRSFQETEIWKRYLECCEIAEEKPCYRVAAEPKIAPRDFSLLDTLPEELVKQVLHPMVGPLCNQCGRTLVFADDQGGSAKLPNRAVYVEEVLRERPLTDDPQHWELRMDPFGWALCAAVSANLWRTLYYEPISVETRDFESPKNPRLSSLFPSGLKYCDEKDEIDLLGPFCFCLIELPVRNLYHYLELEEILCPACAMEKQISHCKHEIERIRSARKAAVVAWGWEQIEEQTRSNRRERASPLDCRSQQHVKRGRQQRNRKKGNRGSRHRNL